MILYSSLTRCAACACGAGVAAFLLGCNYILPFLCQKSQVLSYFRSRILPGHQDMPTYLPSCPGLPSTATGLSAPSQVQVTDTLSDGDLKKMDWLMKPKSTSLQAVASSHVPERNSRESKISRFELGLLGVFVKVGGGNPCLALLTAFKIRQRGTWGSVTLLSWSPRRR